MGTKSVNEKEEIIKCEKYRPIHEYSHLQEFIDNLPYIVMTLLGAFIFLIGLEKLLWGVIAAGLYILYGIVGAFWIIIFVCPYCHFYGTRTCPCGYGQIAVKLIPKKEDNLFMGKFKKHIPVIVPLWFIPLAAGIIFLMLDFSRWMFLLVVLFAVNSFIILPLISRIYGCAHCPQRDTCPWGKGIEVRRKRDNSPGNIKLQKAKDHYHNYI